MGLTRLTGYGLAGLLVTATLAWSATPDGAPAAAVADPTGAAVAAPDAPAAEAPQAPMPPEEELRALERERVELMKKVREASSSAMQERQRAIQANPELAALQKRIGELERELATSRQALREKMKAAGLANQGAPRPALDGMERMRQIDARMRELMGKRLEPPAAAAPAVDAASAGE